MKEKLWSFVVVTSLAPSHSLLLSHSRQHNITIIVCEVPISHSLQHRSIAVY